MNNVDTTNSQTQPTKIWHRKNIHLVNKDNDIKFRGKLSYRHLRIAGWLFLFITGIGIILGLANSAKLVNINSGLLEVLTSAKSLMTPLFLIAAFSQVLMVKNGYKRLIITYALCALGIYVGFIFVYLHFGVGLLSAISGDYTQAFLVAEAFISLMNQSGTLSINIFIDLLLCALVTFFLNYRPTKYFQGNKIYIFRALVALPLLYECGSIALKMLASFEIISLSAFLIPLLSTKPPVAFFIFLALALFVKNRERFYIKKGKTHVDYKAFLETNVNRLHFSLFLVSAIVIAVVIDAFLFILVSSIRINLIPVDTDPSQVDALIFKAFETTYNLGLGACIPMLLIIPFIIFFDYTKTYKDNKVDLIIPVVGIGLLVIAFIEGSFQILKGYLSQINSEPDPASEIRLAISYIKSIFRK